ncbi:MAG: acyl-CoA dehydrogenase family protein [Candidatus Dadabacteria bacterium]|nr:acyl-CoA dehydrogenase family protein [Candidatus Dadabacteria bacterium]MCY4042430.1 acyl-CoA dehydrogenase family protein [Candidatus Dadabacteria bacterium]
MSLNFELSEEQKLFQETLADFCANKIEPLVEEHEKEEKFPMEIFSMLGEMGFLGIMYPEEYGGVGMDKVTDCVFAEEMGKVWSAAAMAVNAHIGLACFPIYKFGTEEQKQKYLVPGIKGEKIGALGLTEPGAGSDARSIRSQAVKEGDKYILNGTKTWITNGSMADFSVVAAYTDKTKKGEGISIFIVEKGFPGFSVSSKIHKLGHRAADTSELIFENCEVPAENLLVGEGGFGSAMETLLGARITHAAKSVGLAQAAYEYALQYATERETFGKPISKHQEISSKLATMATKIEAARLLVYEAAWLYGGGKPALKNASMAKLFAADVVQWVATEAIQVLGGYGYSVEYKAERFFRDARLSSITEGTSEIQRLVIAREIGC